MVGEPQQQTAAHRIVIHRPLTEIEAFFLGNAQKLLEQRPHLARGLCVDSGATAALRIEMIALGEAPSAHQDEKIRLGRAAGFFAFVLEAVSRPAQQQISALDQCRDQCHRPRAAVIMGGEQHAGVARM